MYVPLLGVGFKELNGLGRSTAWVQCGSVTSNTSLGDIMGCAGFLTMFSWTVKLLASVKCVREHNNNDVI